MTIAILIAAAASFAPIKQIDAGVLNIGYAELGPASGTPVILLHGWPYDIHGYEKVAPVLAGKGYHVIVPYLRGYGTTRFLSDATFRNGEQAAVALDIVKLMEALKIDKAILAGFDWGSATVRSRRLVRRTYAHGHFRATPSSRVTSRLPRLKAR